jgi:predicted esterase
MRISQKVNSGGTRRTTYMRILLPPICAICAICAICVPPPGAVAQERREPYVVSEEERRRIDEKKRDLAARLVALAHRREERVVDAAVFLQVAEMADRLQLYGNGRHVNAVLRGLETGLERCALLEKDQAPWLTQPGPTLRGYLSKVDGSVQPYGVVLPQRYDAASKTSWRLDVVLHGRGPTEVTFLQQHEPAPGSEAAKPPDQLFIELHPFGRGNNGWRWAGETDVFEALEAVRKRHLIDENRTMLRGFSMGGHGAWHIGVHHPHVWAAVSPGAGFSETRKYLRLTQPVPEYQEKSWRIYDAVDYALSLFNTPFITYGGEKDPQLQASLNMKEAAQKEGVPLEVLVGPDTEHRYHPESLRRIMEFIGTKERNAKPREVRFSTWTLKYPRCAWVTVDGLEEHYRRAAVRAIAESGAVKLTTENVSDLVLHPVPVGVFRVEADGQTLQVEPARPIELERKEGKWSVRKRDSGLRKRPGLQGPIDDAFTDRFIAVLGTGTPWNAAAHTYAMAELARLREDWRFGFRGEVQVKEDRAVTETDWEHANLVLFGDPGSNRLISRIAGRLPIRWARDGVRFGDRRFGPEHVPALIYPNPLNPRRYVVINSGHTWRRRDLTASNANLFPRLPDWAILKPGPEAPEVAAADYFDEAWKVKPAR